METISKKLYEEEAKIETLQLINAAPNRTLNLHLLVSVLAHRGFATSHDRIKARLQWFNEHDLITLDMEQDPWVVRLKQRAVDVVNGSLELDGIATPSPGE